MKAVAVLILEIEIERTVREACFLRKSCHVLAVGLLEITIILKRDSGIQMFLKGDVLLNGS